MPGSSQQRSSVPSRSTATSSDRIQVPGRRDGECIGATKHHRRAIHHCLYPHLPRLDPRSAARVMGHRTTGHEASTTQMISHSTPPSPALPPTLIHARNDRVKVRRSTRQNPRSRKHAVCQPRWSSRLRMSYREEHHLGWLGRAAIFDLRSSARMRRRRRILPEAHKTMPSTSEKPPLEDIFWTVKQAAPFGCALQAMAHRTLVLFLLLLAPRNIMTGCGLLKKALEG